VKLSCQEQLLPGASLQAKFDFARRAGFAGIELRGRGDGRFVARLPELRAAALGALRTVGYDGWLALECRLRGDPEAALPATSRFLAPFL
jgi:sugar phosphate isomerase/epimerase